MSEKQESPAALRLAVAKKELRLAVQALEAAKERAMLAGIEFETAQDEVDEEQGKERDGDGD